MVWDGHMTQFWPLGSEEKSTGAETLGKVFPCSVREDTRQKWPLLLWLVIVLSTGETQIVATCLWPWWRPIWGQNKQAKDSRTENNWSSMVSLSLRMSQLWSYPLLEFALCEIIKYPHCLNHLKLSFLLGAAKSNIMITKKNSYFVRMWEFHIDFAVTLAALAVLQHLAPCFTPLWLWVVQKPSRVLFQWALLAPHSALEDSAV